MYKYIILSSCLLGSYYLFSKSLELINKPILENKKIPRTLILINGVTFVTSGFIIIYSFGLIKMPRVCSVAQQEKQNELINTLANL